MFKQNHSFNHSLGGKWWTYATDLVVLHVYNRERGDGWQWMIKGAKQIRSKTPFFTKEDAMNDCLSNLYLMIDEAKRGLAHEFQPA